MTLNSNQSHMNDYNPFFSIINYFRVSLYYFITLFAKGPRKALNSVSHKAPVDGGEAKPNCSDLIPEEGRD